MVPELWFMGVFEKQIDKTFMNLLMMIFLDGFHKKAHNL